MSAESELTEGLSMSEEEERLPPDLKEFGSRLLEDMTPDEQLLAAAQRGHGSLVKELLLQGTRVSIDENGTTALHQAAQNGFADIVRIILDHNTDVDIPDSGGYTALHKAAGKGHLDVLGLLINEGCHIDIQDDTYGNTALHEAAWKGFSKSVDLLLKNKSNAFIANRAGCTALHLAAQSGHNQCGRALLYAGCSPDVKNNYGDTPLHTAARYGHAGIARILISARCSVSEQNKNGDTALHIAAAFKRRKIATLLVEGGINAQLTNKQGESATEIARRKEHTSIIEIIHHGHSKPTGGVQLNHASERSKTQSSQQTLSRETTPEIRDNKKKSSGLVSWIKRKFAKEKLEKDGMLKQQLSDGRIQGMDDGSLGLFSQYVKRQGFAYYRDLAGNIRQGPVGYVPNCHCDGTNRPAGLDRPIESKHATIYDQMTSTNNALNERLKELEQHTYKKEAKPQTDAELDMAEQQRILIEKQECLERLRKLNMQEKRIASRHADTGDKHLRDDLQSWLATQISDGRDSDPFSYSIGTKQQRFGDDFDHERIARYEAINSEQFPPPPRLFRSRSDETLTHSEYSFHGRAFKSREAAMEELKTLKHHEEIRERRKLIRAGAKQQSLRAGQGHLSETVCDLQERPGLWVSRENLDENHSKTDTACESHEIPKPDVPDGKHENSRKSSHVRSASEVQAQPERVIGRRERSISPQRKVETKPVAAAPLKSAMRQPRNSSSSGNEVNHIYRSNSLPRNSKVDFKNDSVSSIEPKKTVKTVRYDETVKSAEIAQDMPPSLSPAQAEETLLPAKRETPIGGHDEKYSENNQARGSYHGVAQLRASPADTSQTKDLRDSIMNARKELLARKPEGNRNSDTLNRYNVIPTFEKGNRTNGYPPVNSRMNNLDPRSAYHSQDGLRQNQRPDVPFSHYVNGNYNRQLSQAHLVNRKNQPYATTSLPRPPRMNGHQQNVLRRAPLPSYEEVQSNRMGKPPTTPPANPVTAPPSYAPNTQTAPLPRYTNSTNQQTTNINVNRQQANIPTFQPNETFNHQQKTASVVRRVSQRANTPNPQQTNQWAPQRSNGTAASTSAQYPAPTGRYERSATSIYSKHPDSPVEPASDPLSPNNADSCTSSNPDSGYSGNFYDSNPNAGGSLADQAWYQQNLQSTALKMSTKPISRNMSQPVLPSQYQRNTQMNGAGGAKRMVYTNMTSDV